MNSNTKKMAKANYHSSVITGKEKLTEWLHSNPIKSNFKRILAIIGMFLFPIINFYLLEGYTHNGFAEVRPWAQFFNIVVLELVMLVLFFVLRNLKYALRIQTIVLMIVGLVNYYVYTFRSSPLVPWDIFSIRTAASVADNYDFTPTSRVVVTFLLFLLVIFLERFCVIRLKKWKYYQSIAGAAAACIVLVLFCRQLQVEKFQNKHLLYNKLFTPVFMWQVNGFVVTFIMDLPFLAVDKPAGYDAAEAKELLRSYEDQNTDTVAAAGKNPNIIVIMDEAFSDLKVLGDFTASKDYMPYYHSLEQGAENTITGSMNVSVCGGNTANTEFEFLTGNTMAFLPQGSIPYQQYINGQIAGIPSYLKELGYETYAMHPYNASGWDRDTVYPLMGFDVSYFLPDFFGRTYIRNYVSDASCVQKIIETYEQKDESRPAFIFNVTMQNHGSYSDVYDNFTPDITVAGREGSYALTSYLSLMQYTDRALYDLTNYFANADEDTMIVFFGDHQPNDTVAEPVLELNGSTYLTLTEEQTDQRYEVPYLIWANFDISEETGADTSVNYLAASMLKEAGLPLPAYQNYLLDLKEEYPVISGQKITDAKGNKVADRDTQKALQEYRKIQYYQIFDAQNP